MSSAAVAVALAVWRMGSRWGALAFGAIVLVFAYATVMNVIERPDGVKIGAFFFGTIIVTSLASRAWRMTELRVTGVVVDEIAQRFIDDRRPVGAVGGGLEVQPAAASARRGTADATRWRGPPDGRGTLFVRCDLPHPGGCDTEGSRARTTLGGSPVPAQACSSPALI
jgi:hypothetical protein